MITQCKYQIKGAGSGLYLLDVNTGEKVYKGRSYADCRSKLYELMGWSEPKYWKY